MRNYIFLGDNEDKMKIAFQIYDMNNDGFISNGDLFNTLRMLVGKNYPLKFKGPAVQSTAKCTYPLRFVSSDLKFSVPVSSLISLKQACLCL